MTNDKLLPLPFPVIRQGVTTMASPFSRPYLPMPSGPKIGVWCDWARDVATIAARAIAHATATAIMWFPFKPFTSLSFHLTSLAPTFPTRKGMCPLEGGIGVNATKPLRHRLANPWPRPVTAHPPRVGRPQRRVGVVSK